MFSILKTRKIKTSVGDIEARPSIVTNFIDEQLHSILRPLNFTLTLVFCAKYNIRNNALSVNSIFYSFISLLSVLSIMGLAQYFFHSQETFRRTDVLSELIFIGYMVDTIATNMGSLTILYTNYKNRQNNVLLILTIQNAFKILKIKARKFVKINWAIVVALNCYYLCFNVYFAYIIHQFRIWDILDTYLFLSFDLNVIYVSVLLDLLSHIVEMWIKDINSSGLFGVSDDEAYWITKFDVFMDILEVYQLIEKLLKNLVSDNFLITVATFIDDDDTPPFLKLIFNLH